MKTVRKLVLYSILCIMTSSFLFFPGVRAQDIVYNGVDTEKFPNFIMYPSEVYEYNYSSFISKWQARPEFYMQFEFLKGNDTFLLDMPGVFLYDSPGYGIWGNFYGINDTTGAITHQISDYQIAFWNESILLYGSGRFIPVNASGEVSRSTLDKAAEACNSSWWMGYLNMEVYYNINSFRLWNGPSDYIIANYSSDGIRLNFIVNVSASSMLFTDTLMSRPVQLPPVFSFATHSGLSTVSSRQVTLDLTIPAADNNNDGLPDTDYQYRMYEGGIWSTWEDVTPTMSYDLGSVSAGNYTLTVEVKSMYGVTQEQIEVEYIPSSSDAIPGSSVLLIVAIMGFSISILLSRYRKKK